MAFHGAGKKALQHPEGLVWIDAVIRSPSTDRATTVKALVDTGATLSVVPRKIAVELQLPVIGRRGVPTAKGVAELDECVGIVEVMGRKAYSHILVSDLSVENSFQ